MADYTLSPEGRWLTLRLRKGLVFSDGTPVTTDDVLFTLERAKGLSGPTASIIGTVSVTKVDDRTFTLTSPGSNFALPAILANPAFGILNSTAVKAARRHHRPRRQCQRLPVAALRGLGSLRHRERPRHVRGAARGQPAVVRAEAGLPRGSSCATSTRTTSSPSSGPAASTSPSTSRRARPTRSAPVPGLGGLGGHGHDDALELARLPRPRAQQGPQRMDRQPRLRRGGAPRPRPRRAGRRVASGSTPAAGLIPAGIVGALEDLAPNRRPADTPARHRAPASTGTPSPSSTTAPRPPSRRRPAPRRHRRTPPRPGRTAYPRPS